MNVPKCYIKKQLYTFQQYSTHIIKKSDSCQNLLIFMHSKQNVKYQIETLTKKVAENDCRIPI